MGDTDATLQTGDQVLGNGGTDTINLFAAENNAELPTGAELKDIEIVNLRQDDHTFGDSDDGIDARNFGAAAEQLWQVNGNAKVTELAEGQIAGFRGDVYSGNNDDATVKYQKGVKEATVALDNMDEHLSSDGSEDNSGSEININNDGHTLETVNVSGTVADTDENGVAGLDLNIDSTVETFNLAIDSDIDLRIDGEGGDFYAGIVDFNASESTGGVAFKTLDSDPSGSNDESGVAYETFTTGSGNDTIGFDYLDFAKEEVSVNTGAGNDKFTLNLTGDSEATALSVDLGEGNDKLVLENAESNKDGNLVSADSQSALEESLITVAGLTDGADETIDLSGLDGERVLQSDVNTALDDATEVDTLLDAVDAVAGVDGATGYAMFDFDGNAYVYQDTAGTDSLSAGDTLVELTGVSEDDLVDGDNFVA